MVRVPRLPEVFENRDKLVEKIKEPWCVMLLKNGKEMHLTVRFSSKFNMPLKNSNTLIWRRVV